MGNLNFNFPDDPDDSTRIMQAYIMKHNQQYFDDLPDVAVIVVRTQSKIPRVLLASELL